jgi:regulator of sigma E protease
LILSADGIEFTDWMAWVDYVQDRAGQAMEILIERDGQTQLVTLTPASVIENEKIVGKIGVGVRVLRCF